MIHRFSTDTGVPVPAISAAQMREIDRIALEETGPNLFQMMENAGRTLAAFAMHWLGRGWQKAQIVILAGSGGNGGGGICAGRHLRNRNARVHVLTTGAGKLKDVPESQLRIYRAARGEIMSLERLEKIQADLIIDAMIGYSLQSAPRGTAQECIRRTNAAAAPVLALDVPSGLNATTGDTPGECIQATCTLTLALPKTGLLSERTGDLFLADIGIPQETFRRAGIDYTSPFDDRFWLPLRVST